MKILHLLYAGLGGHGNVFFSMVKADEKKEYAFEAIFFGVEDVREDYIKECRRLNIPWQFVKKKPGSHISFLWKMAKTIKKSQADIIFLHASSNIPAVYVATLGVRHKPKIIVRETQANHLKTKNDKTALKFAMRFADKIIFLSKEYDAAVRQELGKKYRSDKTAIIPNGLDMDLYKPLQAVNKNYVFTIGMQSRLVPLKDHPTLIHAFARLVKQKTEPAVVLKIAGDGESRKQLEELTKKLNLQEKIEFTGMLSENELVPFLQNLDLYVHASLGETMSTAIMQAMACGLPIIASDVPGINNMITHEQNGLLVPAKDKEKMAAALLLLYDNISLRQQLAKNAYEYAVKEFDSKRMLQKYKAIF